MAQAKTFSQSIKYGIIAGLVYVVLLTLQYMNVPRNPLTFGFWKICTYLLILVVFALAALARRKELGGYIDFKTALQTIIVTIIITEVIYAIFNYIYLNYVDPKFFDNYMNNIVQWMEEKGVPQSQIDKQMEMYRSGSTKPSIGNTLLGIGIWIVIDTIFGLIIAAIVKKQQPPFEGSFNQ